MTSFIPALIAVLLVETGGRSVVFPLLRHRSFAAMILGLAVGASAMAGYALAPSMSPHARALMLGIALLLTAADNIARTAPHTPPTTIRATLAFVWRCSASFLAFAFAIWKADPIGAAAGALVGLGGAVILGTRIPPLALGRMRCGAIIAIAISGLYSVLWALRLIA